MQKIEGEFAAALVQQHWQITGQLQALASYADQNFLIRTGDGAYVFKIANPQWNYADLDLETLP